MVPWVYVRFACNNKDLAASLNHVAGRGGTLVSLLDIKYIYTSPPSRGTKYSAVFRQGRWLITGAPLAYRALHPGYSCLDGHEAAALGTFDEVPLPLAFVAVYTGGEPALSSIEGAHGWIGHGNSFMLGPWQQALYGEWGRSSWSWSKFRPTTQQAR